MDEYNQGWDPDVKIFFRKILNSFVAGATFLLVFSTAGLFFRLGFVTNGWQWYNIVFYALFFLTFLLLLLFFYRVWRERTNTIKKNDQPQSPSAP